MIMAILILLILPLLDNSNIRSYSFRPITRFFFWIFIFNFLILLWIGALPVSQPYIYIGQISTLIYFMYFIILPFISLFENTIEQL